MGHFRKLFLFFSIFFISTFANPSAPEPVLLQTADINKIMSEIFAQHVDHKEMNVSIMKHSLKNYIDHFDSDRSYLLQREVEPYLNISDEKAAKLENNYKSGDYSIYSEINNLIQKSISRARSYRSLIEQDHQKLFQEAKKIHLPNSDRESLIPFADTEQELKLRIKDDLVNFLHREMKRYGESAIAGNVPQVLSAYERALRSIEEHYNYRTETGELISQEQQENLFTLHVLKSLAKSLDAHTNFLDPSEAYEMRVRLEKGFDGIGIIFQETPQGIFVGNLVNGGPAAKSGQIELKDQVLEINGQKVSATPFEKLMDLMREEKNDTVTLLLSRKAKGQESDKVFKVNLKREQILVNEDRVDIHSEHFGNGLIGKIALHAFYQNDQGITSEKDLKEAIQHLDKQGNLRGLILDLRDNSGGFLTQAVKVAGLFITNGVVVISKYSNGEEKVYRDMDSHVSFSGPLIILTSKATASAAEIVAQALQDYGVAVIVGDEHTYGKGTIQSQTVTDNPGKNSYFKVTIGKYYTVSGKTPQLRGVKADVVVPSALAKSHIGEEYLEYAIQKEDAIHPEYSDGLADIDTALKPWYLKYYMPNLQHKERAWKEVLPLLKKNSELRLKSNKNFQLFLKRLNGEEDAADPDLPEDENALQTTQKNYGSDDIQMQEAVNILKDMIYLQSKMRHNEYMVGAEVPSVK